MSVASADANWILADDPDAVARFNCWQLWALHNARRRLAGLAEFVLSGPLASVSRRFSAEIAGTGVLTHTRRSGTPFYSEIDAALGVRVGCAENAAAGQMTAEMAMHDWMYSPGHRANILGPFDTFGGWMSVADDGSRWWVCDFARVYP